MRCDSVKFKNLTKIHRTFVAFIQAFLSGNVAKMKGSNKCNNFKYQKYQFDVCKVRTEHGGSEFKLQTL